MSICLFAVAVIFLMALPMTAAAYEVVGGEEGQIPPEPPKTEAPLPVELIIAGAPHSLNPGEGVQITYFLNNAPEGTIITWTTSNENVAVIDEGGFLTAVAPGKVEIIANVGEVRTSTFITVNEIQAQAIKIIVTGSTANSSSGKSFELNVGDRADITAVIEPKEARVTKINWDLSENDVIELTSNEITAIGPGSVTVTVSAGELSDSVIFLVSENTIPKQFLITIGALVISAIALISLIAVIAVQQKKIRERRRKAKEAAKKKAAGAKKKQEAAQKSEDDYMKGYAGKSKDAKDRLTRVYAGPLTKEDNTDPFADEKPKRSGSEETFSIDDIE